MAGFGGRGLHKLQIGCSTDIVSKSRRSDLYLGRPFIRFKSFHLFAAIHLFWLSTALRLPN